MTLEEINNLSSEVIPGKKDDNFEYMVMIGNLCIWWDGLEVKVTCADKPILND